MSHPTLEKLTKQAHDLRKAEEQLTVLKRSIEQFAKGRKEGTLRLAVQMAVPHDYTQELEWKNITFETRPLVEPIINEVLERHALMVFREIELRLGVERHFASSRVSALRTNLQLALRGAEVVMEGATNVD
jgi:hypothetical protein